MKKDQDFKEALRKVMEEPDADLDMYKDFDDSEPTAEEVISSAEGEEKSRE